VFELANCKAKMQVKLQAIAILATLTLASLGIAAPIGSVVLA